MCQVSWTKGVLLEQELKQKIMRKMDKVAEI